MYRFSGNTNFTLPLNMLFIIEKIMKDIIYAKRNGFLVVNYGGISTYDEFYELYNSPILKKYIESFGYNYTVIKRENYIDIEIS